jgi:hypothetical protein
MIRLLICEYCIRWTSWRKIEPEAAPGESRKLCLQVLRLYQASGPVKLGQVAADVGRAIAVACSTGRPLEGFGIRLV